MLAFADVTHHKQTVGLCVRSALGDYWKGKAMDGKKLTGLQCEWGMTQQEFS